MKYTELLSIPVRVLGIYILYSAFLSAKNQYFILSQVGNTNHDEYKIYATTAILEVSLMLIAAFALTKLPLTTSKFLSPTCFKSTFNSDITSEQLQSAAICVLGIYTAIKNIPDLMFNTAQLIILAGQPSDLFNTASELIMKELAAITEILIGVFLCVKSHDITILINQIRSARTAPPPPN